MELRPFRSTQVCEKCGGGWQRLDVVKYCEGVCIPNGRNGFVDAGTVSDSPVGHLHVACNRCGFTWLERSGDGIVPAVIGAVQ